MVVLQDLGKNQLCFFQDRGCDVRCKAWEDGKCKVLEAVGETSSALWKTGLALGRIARSVNPPNPEGG